MELRARLARGAQSISDSVAGAHACPGARPIRKEPFLDLGRCPLPPGFIAFGQSRTPLAGADGFAVHGPVLDLNGARVASPHGPTLRQALSTLSRPKHG